MAQASTILSSFNGGEWSSDLDGRVDNDYYPSSCSYIENFFCRVQGPLSKRSGLRFVNRAKYSDKVSRLIRFQFSTTQTYFLEFGEGYMRVYHDHGPALEASKTVTGITQANPGVLTAASHGYADGDWVYVSGLTGMPEAEGQIYKVANSTTNTFELNDVDDNPIDTTAFDAYVSGGTVARIYEIATPYTESDLAKLRWTQSADVMFIACNGKRPVTLSRLGHANWSMVDYDFVDGPYLTQNATATTLSPSATTGSVTITASAATFVSTDVGRWVRIKSSTGVWGAAQITAYTSSTSVTADVSESFPFVIGASKIWRLGLWTNTTWPQVVEFFQNRLFWFTNVQVDGSYSGDYYSFSPTLTDGTVTDANGVQRQLGSRDVNLVEWAVDNEKALIVGTRDGEWVIKANTLGDAVTQTNINATKSTDFGSRSTQAFRVQSKAVFVQKTGRVVCQTGYSLDTDGFETIDLNLFNTSINEGLVKEIAYASHPDNFLFCVQDDGSLSVLTYNPSQQVKGWQRLNTTGYFDSVACGSSPAGDHDETWFVTQRLINGQYVRMIEYLEDMFRYNALAEDGFFLDCGLTYDGREIGATTIAVTTTTITASTAAFTSDNVGEIIGGYDGWQFIVDDYVDSTHVTGRTVRTGSKKRTRYEGAEWYVYHTTGTVRGLDHLNGEEVAIVGDGAVLVSRTVSGGKVVLSTPSSVVHVGIPYTSLMRTNRTNAGAADGTAQGKIKRLDKIVLRLWRSLGGRFGGEESAFRDAIDTRLPQDSMNRVLPLRTGDTDILDLPSDYNQNGRIEIVHEEPLPFTLVAIMPRLVTQDGR